MNHKNVTVDAILLSTKEKMILHLRPRTISSRQLHDVVLWEGNMSIEKGKYVSYMYELKYNSCPKEKDGKVHKMKVDASTYRDTWYESFSSSELAIKAHIFHIMDGVKDSNMKQKMIDLHQFHDSNNLSPKLTDPIKMFVVFRQHDPAFQVFFSFF